MATPEFILALRERIGHTSLFLPGVTMAVLDDHGGVLLVRRVDGSEWGLVAGIVEPGEQPAVAGVREVLEETGVHVEVERLTSVYTQEPMTYSNGDECQFLDLTFRCRYVAGDARVNDDESVDVRWFPLSDLPELTAHSRDKLALALTDADQPWFAT